MHFSCIWQSKDEKYFIHNHLSFTVKYHRDEQRGVSRIVAFEVKPYRYIVWNEIAVVQCRHYPPC